LSEVLAIAVSSLNPLPAPRPFSVSDRVAVAMPFGKTGNKLKLGLTAPAAAASGRPKARVQCGGRWQRSSLITRPFIRCSYRDTRTLAPVHLVHARACQKPDEMRIESPAIRLRRSLLETSVDIMRPGAGARDPGMVSPNAYNLGKSPFRCHADSAVRTVQRRSRRRINV
jgi:hypothetical protein